MIRDHLKDLMHGCIIDAEELLVLHGGPATGAPRNDGDFAVAVATVAAALFRARWIEETAPDRLLRVLREAALERVRAAGSRCEPR